MVKADPLLIESGNAVHDIDRDGDLDIVTGNHQGDVYILENSYPDGIYEEWDKYKEGKVTGR